MAPPSRVSALGRVADVRRRRWSVALAVVLALGVALVGPAAPAQAKKVYPSSTDVQTAQSKAAKARAAVNKLSDTIDAANVRADALQVTAEQASEAYNAAQAKLQQATATAAAASRASTNAQADLAAARVQLGQFAADSYRSGGDIANVGALLTADGPGTLMDRANTLSQLSTQRDYVLQRVESARVVAELLSQQAQGALTGVKTATATVHAAQVKAEAAVAQQTALLTTLNKEKASLRTQLAALDSKSAQLVEQREAGLRAEAQRKAQATARANGSKVPLNAPNGSSISTTAGAAKAVAFAKAQIGKWYLWGGTGPDRFDCSGLTMRAWEKGGVQIPRVASWQYAASGKISTSQLRPGDLVFYATDLSDYTTIHHVGIYVGGGQMIEAPHTGARIRYSSIWRSDLIGAARP